METGIIFPAKKYCDQQKKYQIFEKTAKKYVFFLENRNGYCILFAE